MVEHPKERKGIMIVIIAMLMARVNIGNTDENSKDDDGNENYEDDEDTDAEDKG